MKTDLKELEINKKKLFEYRKNEAKNNIKKHEQWNNYKKYLKD